MRPAIEVWHDAYQEWADTEGPIEQWAIKPAAVIEADRAELVAEIVAELRGLDGRRYESNLIGWAANHIEAKFGGRDDR